MERTIKISVTPLRTEDDKAWLGDLWLSEWGSETMISRGKTYYLWDLNALIAWHNDTRVGAATYHVANHECELLSINSTVDNLGAGSALVSAVEQSARREGARRTWLITSNDNLDALRFYQRRGYRIVAVYPNAIDEARRMKPSIPCIGHYDIPIHDELELEKLL